MRAIALDIAKDAPRRARTYARELALACHGLGRSPQRFEVALRRSTGDIRRQVHGRHLILYVVRTDEVFVLRILDGARDYEALFGDD